MTEYFGSRKSQNNPKQKSRKAEMSQIFRFCVKCFKISGVFPLGHGTFVLLKKFRMLIDVRVDIPKVVFVFTHAAFISIRSAEN